MGDIGYLCDSVEEIGEVIESLLRENPTERYRQQVRNILAGRAIFDPETQAPHVVRVVDSLRQAG
jgi:hypothetical protein